jgi:hypothetical protein
LGAKGVVGMESWLRADGPTVNGGGAVGIACLI